MIAYDKISNFLYFLLTKILIRKKFPNKMNCGIVKINEIPTEIITYGRWIEDELTFNSKKDVVILITGNPGIPAFYKEFVQQIHLQLSAEVPIWIIGHTGHTKPPDNIFNFYPDIKTAGHLYDLNGNLKHKMEFIKKYVPQNVRIHIIGHSIGCWFILNLLKNSDLANRIFKCYLLFPTIERMAESPNGRFLINFVLKRVAAIIFFASMFALLPKLVQIFLIRIFFVLYRIPSSCTEATLQLIHPVSLKRILLLANQEMIFVKELDENLIFQYKEKLFLYYGSNDPWTPVHYYENLKEKHPGIQAYLCKQGFQHSFVLRDSVELGKIIGNLINETIS